MRALRYEQGGAVPTDPVKDRAYYIDRTKAMKEQLLELLHSGAINEEQFGKYQQEVLGISDRLHKGCPVDEGSAAAMDISETEESLSSFVPVDFNAAPSSPDPSPLEQAAARPSAPRPLKRKAAPTIETAIKKNILSSPAVTPRPTGRQPQVIHRVDQGSSRGQTPEYETYWDKERKQWKRRPIG